MFMLKLSPEVLELIGHELRDDKKALSSLSKSCLLGAKVFQPFLFESLQFQDDDFSTEIFQVSPALGHSVRSLRLQSGNPYHVSHRCNAILNPVWCAQIIQCFDRVKHVFLAHDWSCESESEYSTLEKALVQLVTRRTITSVTMAHCQAIPISKIVNSLSNAPTLFFPRLAFLSCSFSKKELDANYIPRPIWSFYSSKAAGASSGNRINEVDGSPTFRQGSSPAKMSQWTPKTLQVAECDNFWTEGYQYFNMVNLDSLVMEYPAPLHCLRLWAISEITELKLDVCDFEPGAWTSLMRSGVLCKPRNFIITFRNTSHKLEDRLDNINLFLQFIKPCSLSVKVVTNAQEIDKLASEIGRRLIATLHNLPHPVAFKLGLSLYYPGILWPVRRVSYPWKGSESLYDWMDRKESELKICLSPGETNVNFGIYWEGHAVGTWDFFPSPKYRRYLPVPRRFMEELAAAS